MISGSQESLEPSLYFGHEDHLREDSDETICIFRLSMYVNMQFVWYSKEQVGRWHSFVIHVTLLKLNNIINSFIWHSMRYECVRSLDDHNKTVLIDDLLLSILHRHFTLSGIVNWWYRKGHFQHILSDKVRSDILALDTCRCLALQTVWPMFNSNLPVSSELCRYSVV